MKARQKRIKAELLKGKVALAMMFISGALADNGIIFLFIVLFAAIWLGVCMRRLERLGA